jgi:hypothetical protein
MGSKLEKLTAEQPPSSAASYTCLSEDAVRPLGPPALHDDGPRVWTQQDVQ